MNGKIYEKIRCARPGRIAYLAIRKKPVPRIRSKRNVCDSIIASGEKLELMKKNRV
jgi:hypothetical protein